MCRLPTIIEHSIVNVNLLLSVFLSVAEWRVTLAEPLTGRRFIELAFAEAGLPPMVGELSRAMVLLGGLFNRTVREFGELAYQFEAPFVVDGGKYRRAFGGEPTPYREAMRATVAWFREEALVSAGGGWRPGSRGSPPGAG